MKVRVVSSDDVPPVPGTGKYKEIIQALQEIPSGKAVAVEFEDLRKAKRARSAIREAMNQMQVVVRTRLVVNPDGTVTVYYIKL